MNLLDLFVKVGVKDDTQAGLSKISSAVGKGLATAAKVGVAAVGAASVAVAGLTKTAVGEFAEYEQLVGGVETLFKTSAQDVLSYANNAYKTAGLSANDYMETVTSFSASLLQGLGGDTKKAAEMANMAITDMADNANKMGTSMESIQAAYQGFAKQNYTMLDNLKLGYGGTQAEMVRLINDSGILGKKIKDLDGITFDQMVEAIHKVQDQMGITGTTAKEASTTIQGSIASMKAAWSNLMTGLATPGADLGSLIEGFVETGKTALGNIVPAVKTALSGISQVVRQAAPIIAAELPGLVAEVLPSLLSAAGSLVAAFIEGLPTILKAIGDAIPEIMNSIFASIESILPESLVPAFEKLKETINGVIDWLSNLNQGQIDTIIGIAEVVAAVVGVISVLGTVISTISAVSSAIALLTSPIGLVVVAIAGLVAAGITVAKHWDEIKAKFLKGAEELKQDWENMKQAWHNVTSAISTKIQEFGSAVRQGFENVKSAVKTAMENVKSTVQSVVSTAASWGRDLMNNFINGIKEKFAALRDAVSSAAQTVKNFLGFSEPKEGPLSNFHTYAPDMMAMFAKGIRDNDELIRNAFGDSLDMGVASLNMSGDGVATGNSGKSGRDIVLNITELIDGAVLARNQYRYNLDEADRHGENLIVAYS